MEAPSSLTTAAKAGPVGEFGEAGRFARHCLRDAVRDYEQP